MVQGPPTLKGAAGGLTAGVLATEEAERRIRSDGRGDKTVGLTALNQERLVLMGHRGECQRATFCCLV